MLPGGRGVAARELGTGGSGLEVHVLNSNSNGNSNSSSDSRFMAIVIILIHIISNSSDTVGFQNPGRPPAIGDCRAEAGEPGTSYRCPKNETLLQRGTPCRNPRQGCCRCPRENTPPENMTFEKRSLRSMESGAGEQFLPVACRTKAGRKGVFVHRHR